MSLKTRTPHKPRYLTFAICIAVLATLATSSARADTPPPCDDLLTYRIPISRAIDHELRRASREYPRLARVGIALRARSIHRQLLEQCLESGGCTATEIARATRDAIAAQPDLQNSLGYGFLIGGMMVNAALAAEVTTLVTPEVRFSSVFVGSFFGQLSFIGINLLAPYLEPLSSRIRRSTFALVKGARNDRPSDLEAQADAVNATYTLREQHASDRILSLRTAIFLNFQSVDRAANSGDPQLLAPFIADAMMTGYRHFRDLDPADPTIVSAVKVSLLPKVKDVEGLIAATRAYLTEHDPATAQPRSGELSAIEYYDRAITAWLTFP